MPVLDPLRTDFHENAINRECCRATVMASDGERVNWHKTDTLYLFYASFLAVLECSDLDDPPNGEVTLPTERIVGSEATYTCNEGFSLSGNSMRRCQTDGLWSGSAPTCVEGKQL